MRSTPRRLAACAAVIVSAALAAPGTAAPAIERLGVSASYDRTEGLVNVQLSGSATGAGEKEQLVRTWVGLAPGRAACPTSWDAFTKRRGAIARADDDRDLLTAPPDSEPGSIAEITIGGEYDVLLRPRRAGRWRVCAWVTLDERPAGSREDALPDGSASAQASRVISLPSGAQLTGRLAIDTLLRSRRTPALIRDAITRWRAREPGYGAEIRWARLSPDRYPDAVIAVSTGGSGRRQAYYIVSAEGAQPRVVFARHRAFNVGFRVRGRRLEERIPIYAPSDPLCCASRVAIRRLAWKGGSTGRLRVVGRSRVRR